MQDVTYRHLTVRAPEDEAKRIALAAAIEGKSKSAWMLEVCGKRALTVIARYGREAA